MIRSLVALLVVSAPAGDSRPVTASPASQPAPPVIDHARLEQVLAGLQPEPRLSRRLEMVSRLFRDIPYAVSPLGEGPGQLPDPDPRFTTAAFDCTTFVETSLALALARDLRSARRLLDLIRYRDGEVSFAHRNHFTMAQWIPANTRAGFLRDVTGRVGGDRVQIEHKRFGPEEFARRTHPLLDDLAPEDLPSGRFQLPVIPLAAALELGSSIPDGAILSTVRVSFRSKPYRVTHQGLVIHRLGKVYLRHAARNYYGRVVDELLVTYLKRNAGYTKWPVAGVNLQLATVPERYPELISPALGSSAREAPGR